MRYMLDTNICIYAIKHKPSSVIDHLLSKEPTDICISSITYAELMHGVEKSVNKVKNELMVALFLSSITILDYDTHAAESYGIIRAKLESRGDVIGPMDMLIAGHALSRDLILVTNNTREFERIDNLQLENWAL